MTATKRSLCVPVDQVGEFVNDEVLQALRRLLGEFEVEPYAACCRIA